MEHALALVEEGHGQFAQISGFEVHYDLNLEPGQRGRRITAFGETLLRDRNILSTTTLDLVTIDFVALDGDGYPFRELDMHFTVIPVSYQQALLEYLRSSGGLAGVVDASRYGFYAPRRLIPSQP
jgi:hypothetical protein